MKLRKADIARSRDASPLQLFEQGIRSGSTRGWYTRKLRRVLCDILEDVLEGDFEARTAQFVQHAKDDPDWALDVMLSLAWKLRERTGLPKEHADYLNPTSIPGYFKPIKKLFDMNNVAVNWKRVSATYPERDNILDTKGWTREEIAAMLVRARDPMDRAVVLLLASSGVRVGGMDFKWRDLTPVYLEDGRLTADPGESGEVACVALGVYAGSPESYTAFATPEAYRAILEYGRMWADLMKRQPGPEDPLFLATKLLPRPASEPSITKRVRQMAAKAGLRDPGSKSGTRFETQLIHGFRKFFNKTCRETLSGDSLASLIRAEYMMGHKGLVALDQNYFKTGMLEMAAEYVKVVPDLTIDDADRLRLSNERMADNVRRLEGEKGEKIARMEAEMASLREEAARSREEVAELKRRGSVPGTDLVAALKDAAIDEGVPGKVVESLTGMMRQLGAAQEANIRELRREYDAEIDKLKRRMDGTGQPEEGAVDDAVRRDPDPCDCNRP